MDTGGKSAQPKQASVSARSVSVDLASLLGIIVTNYAPTIRFISIAIVVIQAVLALLAAVTGLMLHGDGAYFVFAIAADAPWHLKWAGLPLRIDTYVLSVIPTELIAHWLVPTGLQISAVNALFFYGIPVLQFIVVLYLGWRRCPELLIFPIMQYAFGTVLGFGFPTEMQMGPGFFWICIFCLLQARIPTLLFLVCFTGTVFSHEIAIFGALFLGVWIYRGPQSDFSRITKVKLLSICVAVFLTWLAVRLSGSYAADSAAVHVFDPRRVLNDPTLWLTLLALSALSLWAWLMPVNMPKYRSHLVVALVALAVTLMLGPWVNFAQGRYETGRTLMGILLPLLGFALVITRSRLGVAARETPVAKRLSWVTSLAITAAISVNVGASLVFVRDWTVVVSAFRVYGEGGTLDKPMQLVTLSEASAKLPRQSIEAINRAGFAWTWPYLSVVLADNFRPAAIIQSPNDKVCERGLVDANKGRVARQTLYELMDLQCAPLPAHALSLSKRLLEAFETFWRPAHSAPLRKRASQSGS